MLFQYLFSFFDRVENGNYYIFLRRIFSSKTSARAKIFTGWKMALTLYAVCEKAYLGEHTSSFTP